MCLCWVTISYIILPYLPILHCGLYIARVIAGPNSAMLAWPVGEITEIQPQPPSKVAETQVARTVIAPVERVRATEGHVVKSGWDLNMFQAAEMGST